MALNEEFKEELRKLPDEDISFRPFQIDFANRRIRIRPKVRDFDFRIDAFSADIVSISSATTLSETHHVVLCNASGGAFTVTLPASSGVLGRIYHIKKTDSSANAVTVDGNSSETIDGGTTATISTEFESIMIICDGSNWHII